MPKKPTCPKGQSEYGGSCVDDRSMPKNYKLDEIWSMMSGDTASVERNKQVIQKWIARGDGCAVYENADLGSPDIGHKKFVSFGGKDAQLETDAPPVRLPDIGGSINWRYQLVGLHRGKNKI